MSVHLTLTSHLARDARGQACAPDMVDIKIKIRGQVLYRTPALA